MVSRHVMSGVVWGRAPQIVHERGHANDKAVGPLLFSQPEGEMVDALHVFPAVRQIVQAAKAPPHLFIGRRQYLRFLQNCLHTPAFDSKIPQVSDVFLRPVAILLSDRTCLCGW